MSSDTTTATATATTTLTKEDILKAAKKYKQENIAIWCPNCKKNCLLVIGQEGSGGACGASISVDITYNHACPTCLAKGTSSVSYNDDYDF